MDEEDEEDAEDEDDDAEEADEDDDMEADEGEGCCGEGLASKSADQKAPLKSDPRIVGERKISVQSRCGV